MPPASALTRGPVDYLGHLGAPGDVAAVVAFLASDAARFVTAERVAVNGGHTIA